MTHSREWPYDYDCGGRKYLCNQFLFHNSSDTNVFILFVYFCRHTDVNYGNKLSKLEANFKNYQSPHGSQMATPLLNSDSVVA